MDRPRCALWVWYRGDCFRGFQTQLEGPTVQATLKAALGKVGITAYAAPAGRTDKGVHARMQVVSLPAPSHLTAAELEATLPGHLPAGVGVAAARWAPKSFHAQWSAIGKEYRYRLRLGPGRTEWAPFSWDPGVDERLHAPGGVDPAQLAAALRSCEGARDFVSFHEKSSKRRTRTLQRAELVDLGGGLFEARLVGDGFGRYQVRYLVGSSVAVACGALSVDQLQGALCQGLPIPGVRAPATGLILWETHYPPAVDPFSAADRQAAPGVPGGPPWVAPSLL